MQLKKNLLVALLIASPSVWAQAPVEDINDPNRHRNAGGGIEAEIYQQLQQLREEIMTLRGTVEEQGHQLRQLKQQGLDRYIDIDRRLSALAGGAAGTTVSSSAVTSAAHAVAAPLAEASDAAGAASATAAPAATAAATANVSGGITGKASVDYASAYSLVKARQYEQAIEAFKAYVEAYPNERYTPNAWYWLGELYVAISPQNLEASSQAFQTLLAKHPDNGKVPAAMYKLGTVYFMQDKRDKARELLTHVIDRYGNTGNSAVIKAREFLRKNY